MKLYDKKYELIYNFVVKIATKISKKIDIQEIEQEIRESRHPIGNAVLAAENHVMLMVSKDANPKQLRSLMSFVLWKALMSSKYRYPFFEFLHWLKYELNKIDLEPYRRPSNEWGMNTGAAIRKAQKTKERSNG